MRYQKLGNTDIDVSVIALGTWGLGGGSVWTDRDSTVEDTRNLLDICREYGVNYIDTRCKRGAARQGIEGQKTGLYPAKQMLPELEK